MMQNSWFRCELWSWQVSRCTSFSIMTFPSPYHGEATDGSGNRW